MKPLSPATLFPQPVSAAVRSSLAALDLTDLLRAGMKLYDPLDSGRSKTLIDITNQIIDRQVDPYSHHQIAKRSGGTRFIDSPDNYLRDFQQWLLYKVLYLVEPHGSCHAYRPKRSVKTCAEQHLGAKWLLHIDLKDFFSSIDERSVYYTFLKSYGFSKLLSFQLARITTHADVGRRAPQSLGGTARQQLSSIPAFQGPNVDLHPNSRILSSPEYISARRYFARANYHPVNLGFLPQGAPTSGHLANLAAYSLDESLNSFAQEHSMTYTRYADDLFLSHAKVLPGDPSEIIRQISALVRDNHFEVNAKKTRISTRSSRPRVLGVYVDVGHLQVKKSLRRKIDWNIRGMQKYGLLQHAKYCEFESPGHLISHVNGLIGYVHQIDPAWARSRQLELATLRRQNTATTKSTAI